MTKEINEFPRGKELYCPKCYFDDDREVLRIDCDGHRECKHINLVASIGDSRLCRDCGKRIK